MEPRRALFVLLDLNGTLVHRDTSAGPFSVRPGTLALFRTLRRHANVAICTSMQPKNAHRAMKAIADACLHEQEQQRYETRRALDDGWRVEGSQYLGQRVSCRALDETGATLSHSEGCIRGWLDATRSDYLDSSGQPAALWHVYLTTGELAGEEIDLELHDVLDSLVESRNDQQPVEARRAAWAGRRNRRALDGRPQGRLDAVAVFADGLEAAARLHLAEQQQHRVHRLHELHRESPLLLGLPRAPRLAQQGGDALGAAREASPHDSCSAS